jgi:hypothetical protein
LRKRSKQRRTSCGDGGAFKFAIRDNEIDSEQRREWSIKEERQTKIRRCSLFLTIWGSDIDFEQKDNGPAMNKGIGRGYSGVLYFKVV